MRNKIILLPIYLLFGSCSLPNNSKINIADNNLIGCWRLEGKGISYAHLDFKRDSTAIFTSRADTVYRFKYWVDKSFLMLETNNHIYKCPVTEYSDNTFSFKDEIINNKILNYSRDSCIAE